MDTKDLLGRRIRELRKKRGLTLERMAEAANVDVKYLGSIERGAENPTLAVLEKIAKALTTSLTQLLDFEYTVTGTRVLRQRIARALAGCDEKELQQILKLVLAIKN